jgi:endonuclease/exonuclease/phosphatase family metal-dependent hydrolase
MRNICNFHRCSFLLAASLLAVAVSAPEAKSADAAEAASAAMLKILSCNVRVPQPEDERAGDGWEARRQLCGDTIVDQHADIVCLQEARGYQVDELKRRLPDFDATGMSLPVREVVQNNAIMYSRKRFELVSSGGFWFSEQPHVAGSFGWDTKSPRHANWARLRDRDNGAEFVVWNTHFDHIGQQAREEQARMMVEAAAAFDPIGIPQVLTGDMNAKSTNRAIKVLKEGGWRDTYAALHGPQDPGFTFHGFEGEARQAKGGGSKIDWIFTRGDFKPLTAEIIRDGRGGRYPSDHYFLSATLQVPENPE